jgi:hypothetical protein
MKITSAKEPDVYRKAYRLAMSVYAASRNFPPEERYALTSQIRRSSRSMYLNLREARAERRYEANFVSRLTDGNGENVETDCPESSDLCPLSSDLCPLSSDLCPLSSVLCPLSSVLCR